MHPAKIAEKNCVDFYKLGQLIQQQSKWLSQTEQENIFGGVSQTKLDSAFTFAHVRCMSSAGYLKSPKGCNSKGSISGSVYKMSPANNNNTKGLTRVMTRPLSTQRHENMFSNDTFEQQSSIGKVRIKWQQANYTNENDSQKSYEGLYEEDTSSNKTDHMVKTHF